MRRFALVLLLVLSVPLFAWDDTGHQIVAGIAWDNMTPQARQRAVNLMLSAPSDACLRNLMPTDSRPEAQRQREFFIVASTWSDIVRPEEDEPSPCDRFHRQPWHFINFFWQGNSPDGEDVDREPPIPNAVEQLSLLRAFVMCDMPRCGTTPAERATALAWMLHLTGDIHQPLHTAARITTRNEDGDRGGGLFRLAGNRTLHSFWDNIVDNAEGQGQNESFRSYIDRMIREISAEHPRTDFNGRLRSGEFNAWALEGFEITKRVAYPNSLRENRRPSQTYLDNAFEESKPAIALAGYRLADLMNQMFQ